MNLSKIAEKKAFITLDFSGIEKEFTNIQELRMFVQSQQKAWSWLRRAAQEDDDLNRVWDPFCTYSTQTEEFIKWFTTRLGQNEFQADAINFKNQTRSAVDHGFILDDAPNARFVFERKRQ